MSTDRIKIDGGAIPIKAIALIVKKYLTKIKYSIKYLRPVFYKSVYKTRVEISKPAVSSDCGLRSTLECYSRMRAILWNYSNKDVG